MTDLSKEADTLGYPAIVPALGSGRFLHNQRLGKVVIKPSVPISKAHLYFLLRTDDYRSEILASATGTTVKHTSPSRIKAFKLPFPPNNLSQEYARTTEILLKRFSANEDESRTLAALRNALLPRLLSGEIRIQQAENLVAEAV
jgi:type I restriction enzyme, S subunit